jgi:NAD/NADP transhydrogenase beta subunit
MKILEWITGVGTIGLIMIVAGLMFANQGLVIGGSTVFSSTVIATAILARAKNNP